MPNQPNQPQNNPAEKRQKDMPNQNPDRSREEKQQSGKDGCGC